MIDRNENSVDPYQTVKTVAENSDENTHSPIGLPVMKIALIVALIVCLAIYILRLDQVVGLFVDDGWYILLAKSLATGQGYSLINSPSPGILPLYPPAFPFLLSLVYRLSPNFPDNVWLLKSVSVAAMMAIGIIGYRYFVKERNLPPMLALGICVAAVLSPPLVFMATSTMMSECVFALIFLLTVVVMEKCRRAETISAQMKLAAVGGTLASIAFLTRSIAISVIAAGFLYLLKARLLKPAILFAVIVAALCGPWVIYTRLHAPTAAQQTEQGGHIVLPYTQQFWQKRAGFGFSGTITAAGLPERVFNNIVEVSGRDIGRIIVTPLFEALRDPYQEAQKMSVKQGGRGDTWSLSFVLSLFAVIGLIVVARERMTMAEFAMPLSLAVTFLWPWETFRFVLPLIPFVIFYFLMGVRGLVQLIQKSSGAAAQSKVVMAVAALIVAVNLYGNVSYILKMNNMLDRPQWLQTFDEAETMLKWVKANVPQSDAVASLNPPLVHLYTGHKTIASDDPARNWENWKRLGVRYVVNASVYAEPPDSAEQKFKVVYRARGRVNFRVVDLGPAESRPNW
ncbi:MAG: hypothetical protein SF097_24660 [Acidobacteriota bacterium]|nr:hypothetical protein [Acidobacteriota bacterium]